MRGRRLALLGCLGVVVALGVATAVLVLTGRGGSANAAIVVSDSACAPNWAAPASGRTIFDVENTSASTVYDVQLVGAERGAIYGEIHMLAPATTVPLDVVLPPGRYSFRCQGGVGYGLSSETETVTGPRVAGAHPYLPVSPDHLQVAADDYHQSLAPLVTRLRVDTDRLAAAVQAGQLDAARKLWLPAHLDYARLGVAYGTFGKLNDAIDGRPLGLVGGVHDPSFAGFLRLEYGLWHGQSRAQLVPPATALDRAVHTLARRFPSMQIPAGDLTLRAHEILENTLQFELTGETDEGSDTNLATALANVQGTQLAVAALRPALRLTDPRLLAGVSSGLARTAATLEGYRRPDGSWPGVGVLSTAQRERLDSRVSGLLEQLELVPTRLATSSPPQGGVDNG
jgi:iron uptake system EfeUOB component EfeO/EfeM